MAAAKSLGEKLLASALVLLIVGVFAVTISGASIYDDAVEIQQMAEVGLRDAWSLRLNGYYRPLRTYAWVAVRDAFGWFSPSVLHWLNLAAHTVAATLLYRLARRRSGVVAAAATSAVFAFFPWSYEAVFWAAAVNHPAMHACGLGALLCVMARRPNARTAVAGALLSAAALLLHELAVLYVVFAFCAALLRGRTRISIAALTPALIGLVLFASMRVFVPPTTATRMDGDLVRIANNLLILLQAPAVPWVVLLRSGLGVIGLPTQMERTQILLAAAALFFACTLVPAWRSRRGRATWGIGFGIWLVFSAAIAASLSVEYLLTSPRMHYAGAIGIALCVGAAVSVLWTRESKILRGFLAVLMVSWIGWCASYVSLRGIENARIGAALRTIGVDVAASPPDARVLVVNFPFWNAPRYPAFLLGNEGLQIYQEGGSGPDGFMYAQNGVRRPTWFQSMPTADSDDTAFRYALYEGAAPESLHDVTHIYRFEYDDPGVRVRRVAVRGNVVRVPSSVATSTAAFTAPPDDRDALRLSIREARVCGAQVHLDLEWEMLKPVPSDLTVFVHVYDARGDRLVAADADPADGMITLGSLDAGRSLRETRAIALPSEGAPGNHSVRVGVYRRSDGSRLAARAIDGVVLSGTELEAALDSCR
jgi:hypothetical protein